jgi:hypothetical protein
MQRLGPIRVGTGDGAARALVFLDTFTFRRRELKVRSIATLAILRSALEGPFHQKFLAILTKETLHSVVIHSG